MCSPKERERDKEIVFDCNDEDDEIKSVVHIYVCIIRSASVSRTLFPFSKCGFAPLTICFPHSHDFAGCVCMSLLSSYETLQDS